MHAFADKMHINIALEPSLSSLKRIIAAPAGQGSQKTCTLTLSPLAAPTPISARA